MAEGSTRRLPQTQGTSGEPGQRGRCAEAGPHSCFLSAFRLQKSELDKGDEEEKTLKVSEAREHEGTADHRPLTRVPASSGPVSGPTGVSSVLLSCPRESPP